MQKAPFLERVAKHYYAQFGAGIDEYCFIFPSKRAISFFRHYLQNEVSKPIFSPYCCTINDFVTQQEETLEVLDETALLFELYSCYKKIHQELGKSLESFDEFLFWGRLILKDFDLIDRFLIKVKPFFTNVDDYQQLKDDFSYLDEETFQTIQQFWRGFERKTDHEPLERFVDFWKELPILYDRFNQSLSEKKSCYEGHVYRLIGENPEPYVEYLIKEKRYKRYIFVGLYGLSRSEKEFFKALRLNNLCEFVWDEQVEVLKNSQDPVTKILEEDKRLLGQVADFVQEKEQSFLPELVSLCKCTSAVAQAKAISHILLKIDQGKFDSEELNKAIILPDEELLIPVVSSIPEAYQSLNVSMGYPLERTAIAVLINKWKLLMVSDRKGLTVPLDRLRSFLANKILSPLGDELNQLIALSEEANRYYYKITDLRAKLYPECAIDEDNFLFERVDALLGERLSEAQEQELIRKYDLREGLEAPSLKEQLLKRVLVSALFGVKKTAGDLLRSLIMILRSIYELALIQETESLKEGVKVSIFSAFDKEFIHHYIRLANRLLTLTHDYAQDLSFSPKSCIQLLDGLAHGVKIPFEGDPLLGLQVMGCLESRSLSFDYLIYLSASEGCLPKQAYQSSLIPYTLQVCYGLPSREFHDAVSAYQFYQTIAQSKHLFMLYGEDDAMGTRGEESRYVKQLRYLYGVKFLEQNVDILPYKHSIPELVVDKQNFSVQEKLRLYFDNPDKPLSITKLLTYARCPLDFYFHYVEEVNDLSSPDALIAPNEYGDVLHQTMDLLYHDQLGKVVSRDFYELYLSDMGYGLILKTLRQTRAYKQLKRSETLWQEIESDALVKNIINLLKYDALWAGKLMYLGGEVRVQLPIENLPLNDGSLVTLYFKGSIDRCDAVLDNQGRTERIRVLDYKTGGDQVFPITDKAFAEFQEKVVQAPDQKYKAMVQTLFYCEMLRNGQFYEGQGLEALERVLKDKSLELYPALLLTRLLGSSPESYNSDYQICERKGAEPTSYYSSGIQDVLLKSVRALLIELFDFTIPFTARRQGASCEFCIHD